MAKLTRTMKFKYFSWDYSWSIDLRQNSRNHYRPGGFSQAI